MAVKVPPTPLPPQPPPPPPPLKCTECTCPNGWLSRTVPAHCHFALLQLRSQLEVFGVQVDSVHLQSSYVASLSVSFEVILNSPLEQQSSSLVDFNNYLSGMFLTFAGFPVRDGNRGLMGISNACKFKDWP